METNKQIRTKKSVEIEIAKLEIEEQELRVKIEQIILERRKLWLELEYNTLDK